jgi:hypothetical protein
MFQLLILHYVLSGNSWALVSRQQSAPITRAACAQAIAPAWPKKSIVSASDKMVLKCAAL